MESQEAGLGTPQSESSQRSVKYPSSGSVWPLGREEAVPLAGILITPDSLRSREIGI